MTRPTTLTAFCIVYLAGVQSTIGADAPTRLATVVDSAGVDSELTDLKFSGKLSRFSGYYVSLAVNTGTFEIAIPLSDLISIKQTDAKNRTFDVTYQWHGKEQHVSGTLASGEFTGKGDFGDTKITTSNLKQLVFTDPPKASDQKQKTELAKRLRTNRATLTLSDGSEVPVANLQRHDSYYSTEGYLIGGTTRYRHYTDFRFKRGESLLTIEFAKLKRIAFGDKNTVTVTLTNDKTATGTLANEKGAGVEGFTGFNQNGNFFIPAKQIKAVSFGAAK